MEIAAALFMKIFPQNSFKINFIIKMKIENQKYKTLKYK